VPVHEDIKRGGPRRDQWIEAYQQSLRNLAVNGIDVVCYNFMPILDWTRTDLRYVLSDGGWALRFDQDAFAAFDLFILARAGAAAEYDDEETARARTYYDDLSSEGRELLVRTIIAGLPGAEEGYTLATLRTMLATYADIDAAALRENLGYFLRAVVPVATEVGVRMAIHPDDPPRPLLGLSRVASTQEDVRWLFNAAPSAANGLTFCTGSFGVRATTTWWRWPQNSPPGSTSPTCARPCARRTRSASTKATTCSVTSTWWGSSPHSSPRSAGANATEARESRCGPTTATSSSTTKDGRPTPATP
jgi:mannonate dehydratase